MNNSGFLLMKLHMIGIFAGIGLLVSGASMMSSAPGIEKITIGLPLTISGMLTVGIIGLLKSKTARNLPF